MKQNPKYTFYAFNFWECHYIGLNIMKDGELDTFYDLRLDQAKSLAYQILNACQQFEEFEQQVKETEEN